MKTPSPSLFLLLLLWWVIPGSVLAVDDLDSRYVTLEPVVVNMESSDRARYLQAKIQLEAAEMDDARQIREHIPAVRDRLIQVMGGARPTTCVAARPAKTCVRKRWRNSTNCWRN